MIYCDQAATSWPKPAEVIEAVTRSLADGPGSPGRSAHQGALTAARLVFSAREALAELLGVEEWDRIVFTLNVTMALNLAFSGLLSPGDHVLTTAFEHNSVMRPLMRLARERGVRVSLVGPGPDGLVGAEGFARRRRKDTRLAVVNHASNVTGALAPLAEIKAALGPVPLVVDTAQSAGVIPLAPAGRFCDVLAFTGHKGLLGPTGTGGLWVRPGLDIRPLVQGGTGSRSEREEQPDFLPDALEAGTPNTHGLAGLAAGIRFVLATGVQRIREHELGLTRDFLAGLAGIRGAQVYGPRDPERRTAVISLNLAGWSPSDLALALDREFGIMTRAGLHCAPRVHRTLGTFPQGVVRFSFGWFNTSDEVGRVLEALGKLSRRV
ncbi:MAG: aminotransferase class V-fold PLP-dependent enzyme [Thermodesulfobacteriota bacterium]